MVWGQGTFRLHRQQGWKVLMGQEQVTEWWRPLCPQLSSCSWQSWSTQMPQVLVPCHQLVEPLFAAGGGFCLFSQLTLKMKPKNIN